MARRRYWAIETRSGGDPSPATAAFVARSRGDETFEWPADPSHKASVWGATEKPYVVDVEFFRTDDGELIPTGVSIRRTFPTSVKKRRDEYVFADGITPEPLEASDLRLRIGHIIRAAAAAVEEPPGDDRPKKLRDKVDRLLVPRGGPSAKYYRDLLEFERKCKQRGLSPAKELARRTGIPTNRAYQHLHVARHTYGHKKEESAS